MGISQNYAACYVSASVLVVMSFFFMRLAKEAYNLGIKSQFYKHNLINMVLPGIIMICMGAFIAILPMLAGIMMKYYDNEPIKYEMQQDTTPQWLEANREITINVPLNQIALFSGVLVNDFAKIFANQPKATVLITPHGSSDLGGTAKQLRNLLVMKGCKNVKIKNMTKRHIEDSKAKDNAGFLILMKFNIIQ